MEKCEELKNLLHFSYFFQYLLFFNNRAFHDFNILRSFYELARFIAHCFDAAENILICRVV